MWHGIFRRWREGWSVWPGNRHPSLDIVWMTEGPFCSEEFLFHCHLVKHRSMWELRCCDQKLNFYFLAFFTSLHSVSTVAVFVCPSVCTHTKTYERPKWFLWNSIYRKVLLSTTGIVKIEENNRPVRMLYAFLHTSPA